jgi:4-hydroxybenzoate polyprenyltransferase
MDGTLLATDILWESLFILLKKNPVRFFCFLPTLIFKGKAYFKHRLARMVRINPSLLPYRAELLKFLEREKYEGREIFLATASDQYPAEAVSEHIGLFSGVLASDGNINLSGQCKAEAIKKYVQEDAFDYIGNDKKDLPICRAARQAYLVCPSRRVEKFANQNLADCRVLIRKPTILHPLLSCLRVHQWAKNLLLFVPLVTSHLIVQWEYTLITILAFLAFSFCASGVYILNDLLDLESDRQDPHKKHRPFASGALPIQWAPVLLFICFGGCFFVTWWMLPPIFGVVLVTYLVVTTSYSFYLKGIPLVDVFLLAGLYTFRVFAGGLIIGIAISPWLLAFSIFFFLSLALMKRFIELERRQKEGEVSVKGRGYRVGDLSFVGVIGCVSGYLSIVVLALYMTSQTIEELYNSPQGLWVVSLLLLYWMTRVWMISFRGEMNFDPIVFALRDRTSYLVGASIALIVWLSAIGV